MAKKNDNLKKPEDITPEERREWGRKGGKASGVAKRKRKQLKEELLAILSDGDIQKQLCLALIDKGINGDSRAFEVIRDTIGERPKESVEVKTVDTDWFV